jgi:hypothetical protein
MPMRTIEADYVVVGTGAAAMAFVDTLLTETDATVAMIDRRSHAGGHWNDAYSFVRLHGPAAFYGVASKVLKEPAREQVSVNRGEDELASQPEIVNYFDDLMRQRFVASGRVAWFPMTDYRSTADGVHHATATLTGEALRFRARRKFVDATLSDVQVPSTHVPNFAVSAGVQCVPINDLPRIRRPFRSFTIIGSGKTGMDACLWLMQHGVSPEAIRWIRPRDHWMLPRRQYRPENFDALIGAFVDQFQVMIDASSIADLFRRLEDRGHLVRLDGSVEPTTYRCATVSPKEIEQLRQIRDVVRMGHVVAIAPDRLTFAKGELQADPDTLYVDCSAPGVAPQPSRRVFEEDRINLLWVSWCRPSFSAALIAFVESRFDGDDEKNALCGPVDSPEKPLDWVTMWIATLANMARWRRNEAVSAWMAACRLDIMSSILSTQDRDDPRVQGAMAALQERVAGAAQHLPQLLDRN